MSIKNATAVATAPEKGHIAQPYQAEIQIQGTADLLLNRWNDDRVALANGSSDEVEARVYRCPDGTLGIPGGYLQQAIVKAAPYQRIPRFLHGDALNLYRAGIAVSTDLASLGSDSWDYLDLRRVRIVGRNATQTRTRPAMRAGWTAAFLVQVVLPEYIRPDDLRAALEDAGKLVGIGDFRPTFGRFALTRFALLSALPPTT